jgi:hypothetical protein
MTCAKADVPESVARALDGMPVDCFKDYLWTPFGSDRLN